jgi:nucleoside-diphosphate-sugar epimerase
VKEVCIIGGSRYFGKHLIEQLVAGGIAVTVVNRGSAPAPAGTTHLLADRDDEASLRAALGSRTFHVVIDQVCYTPRQAETARRVFAGRTGRYVMTSTIEVYDQVTAATAPVREDAVDLTTWPVRLDLPWHDPDFRESAYGEGKRQAEAAFTRNAPFEFAAVRSAHVVGGGAADFTGRLEHYISRVLAGEPIAVHAVNHRSSFITDREIAEVLAWVAAADFTGPVNAASHGELDVTDICAAIGPDPVYAVVAPGAPASPYAFDRYYAMDTARAAALGFRFSDAREWLGRVVAEARAA